MLFRLFAPAASSVPMEAPALVDADCEMIVEEERTTPEAEPEEPAEGGGSVEVLAWLNEQGFKEGDLRSDTIIDGIAKSPMLLACEKGKLEVCKFLYEHGAVEDIAKEKGEF